MFVGHKKRAVIYARMRVAVAPVKMRVVATTLADVLHVATLTRTKQMRHSRRQKIEFFL